MSSNIECMQQHDIMTRALTGDRTVNGSSPAAVKTFSLRFGTLAIPFTPPC